MDSTSQHLAKGERERVILDTVCSPFRARWCQKRWLTLFATGSSPTLYCPAADVATPSVANTQCTQRKTKNPLLECKKLANEGVHYPFRAALYAAIIHHVYKIACFFNQLTDTRSLPLKFVTRRSNDQNYRNTATAAPILILLKVIHFYVFQILSIDFLLEGITKGYGFKVYC